MNLLLNSTEQGLIFGIMVLGVYITYKILDFPDLSVDGTFPLGAAVAASAVLAGINPVLAIILSMGAGMVAGAVTGFLHVKLKISNLLSGILVMIGAYSINLRIMGKSNVPLFNTKTIFDVPFLNEIKILNVSLKSIIIIFLVVAIIKVLLDLFLKTKLGFLIKATGDNPQLVTSLGMDIGSTKIIALMLSNGLAAMSGAMVAQFQGYSDVGMGTGIVVMGLASVILGDSIFKKVTFMATTTMVLFGSVLYKLSIAIALELGFPPSDLKLITALIVVIALGINNSKMKFNKRSLIAGGKSNVTNT